MNPIIYASVRKTCDKLNNLELAALNNVAQQNESPRNRPFDYEIVAHLFTETGGTRMHNDVKDALASITLGRLTAKVSIEDKLKEILSNMGFSDKTCDAIVSSMKVNPENINMEDIWSKNWEDYSDTFMSSLIYKAGREAINFREEITDKDN